MSISLGYMPESVIAGLYVKFFLSVKKLSNYFPEWMHHFVFPQAVMSDPISLHPHQDLVLSSVFHFNHSG